MVGRGIAKTWNGLPEHFRGEATTEDTACSRQRQFKHFGALRQRYIGRLEPERQSFLRVRDCLFFRVPRAGASWKLWEDRGPAFHFGIEFDDETKFHEVKA